MARQSMDMIVRRGTLLALAGGAIMATLAGARADDLKVLETNPAANTVMDTHSDGFFVRFNQPVDHINSRLLVKRGNDVVETLVPRLQSNPNVLFSRAGVSYQRAGSETLASVRAFSRTGIPAAVLPWLH